MPKSELYSCIMGGKKEKSEWNRGQRGENGVMRRPRARQEVRNLEAPFSLKQRKKERGSGSHLP